MKEETYNKKRIFISLFVILILALAFVLYNNKNQTITGDSIQTKGWGFSNYPFNQYPNTVQTEITISHDVVKGLRWGHYITDIADQLVEAADFENNLINLAQVNSPAPIPTSSLDIVTSASKYLTGTFKEETKCMGKIGEKYYWAKNDIKLVVVSDVIWKQCSYYDDWKVALIRHRYFTKEGKIICTQDSTKLFTQQWNDPSGKLNRNTWGC